MGARRGTDTAEIIPPDATPGEVEAAVQPAKRRASASDAVVVNTEHDATTGQVTKRVFLLPEKDV